jgi:hypothetical protein
MARNGTEFGVRVSALGERGLLAPVEMPQGLYFPGFSAVDANPDWAIRQLSRHFRLGAAMAASRRRGAVCRGWRIDRSTAVYCRDARNHRWSQPVYAPTNVGWPGGPQRH